MYTTVKDIAFLHFDVDYCFISPHIVLHQTLIVLLDEFECGM